MASPLNVPRITTRAVGKRTTEAQNPKKTKEVIHQDTQNNPLFNQVVLQEIFGYLENSSLMECRLINKCWNEASCRILRKVGGYIKFTNECISYGFPPRFSLFGQRQRTNFGIQDMPNLINCIRSASNFPFTKFNIKTNVVLAKHRHVFKRFLQFISPWTTDLLLTYDRKTELKDPLNGITFPFLKTFTLYDEYNTNKTTWQLAANILKNASSLEKLKISSSQKFGIAQILDTLATASLPNFSHFVINFPLDAEDFGKLSGLKIKLKKVELTIFKMNIDASVFKSFLKSQSASLEELELTVSEGRLDVEKHELKIEFPRMEKLKKLTLDMVGVDFETPMSTSFPCISYVGQFPVLKSLNFSFRMHEKNCFDFFKSSITPSKSIIELEFAQRCEGNSEILLSAARLFPSLKKLSVPTAYKKVVDVAYQYWPMLEDLALILASRDETAEDIITGLPITQYQKISHLPGRRFSKIADKIRQIYKRKAISCLENLKILRIKPEPYSYGCKPLDALLLGAAYKHEILKLPSLKCVDFRKKCPPRDEDAKQVLAKLRKKFVVLL